LAAAFACTGVLADDDDGVMGVWEGNFTSPGWEARTIKAKIWGVKKGAWDGKFTVYENDAAIGEGTLSDPTTDTTFAFTGSANVSGEYFLSATAIEGKMSGQIIPGKESKKGNIRPDKKAGAPIAFEMTRQQIKPPTLGAPAPEGAIVLLKDGNQDAWVTRPEKWNPIANGGFEVASPAIVTKQEFGSAKIHIEFCTPYMPNEGVGSQARGNSGVYVQGRYEIQVLDSFGVTPQNNLCGGIYKIAVPLAEAALPPLTWQTYDIEFHAPKFDASGKKTQDAELTVLHNGIVIHDKLKLPAATPGGITDVEGPTGPILLQHHGDRVQYANIWVQPIND